MAMLEHSSDGEAEHASLARARAWLEVNELVLAHNNGTGGGAVLAGIEEHVGALFTVLQSQPEGCSLWWSANVLLARTQLLPAEVLLRPRGLERSRSWSRGALEAVGRAGHWRLTEEITAIAGKAARLYSSAEGDPASSKGFYLLVAQLEHKHAGRSGKSCGWICAGPAWPAIADGASREAIWFHEHIEAQLAPTFFCHDADHIGEAADKVYEAVIPRASRERLRSRSKRADPVSIRPRPRRGGFDPSREGADLHRYLAVVLRRAVSHHVRECRGEDSPLKGVYNWHRVLVQRLKRVLADPRWSALHPNVDFLLERLDRSRSRSVLEGSKGPDRSLKGMYGSWLKVYRDSDPPFDGLLAEIEADQDLMQALDLVATAREQKLHPIRELDGALRRWRTRQPDLDLGQVAPMAAQHDENGNLENARENILAMQRLFAEAGDRRGFELADGFVRALKGPNGPARASVSQQFATYVIEHRDEALKRRLLSLLEGTEA